MVEHPLASVVVIGGGVAGMAAALELAKSGCHVTLVEADSRLGGRVRTVDHPDIAPWPIALGAEFVHGRGSVLHDLAQDHGWTFSEELFNLEHVGGKKKTTTKKATTTTTTTEEHSGTAEAAAAAASSHGRAEGRTLHSGGLGGAPAVGNLEHGGRRRTHVEHAVVQQLKQLQHSVCVFVDGALVPYSLGGGGDPPPPHNLEFLERHFFASSAVTTTPHSSSAGPHDRTQQYARQFWETHVLPLAERVYEPQGEPEPLPPNPEPRTLNRNRTRTRT
jgi:hypothetical protein